MLRLSHSVDELLRWNFLGIPTQVGVKPGVSAYKYVENINTRGTRPLCTSD